MGKIAKTSLRFDNFWGDNVERSDKTIRSNLKVVKSQKAKSYLVDEIQKLYLFFRTNFSIFRYEAKCERKLFAFVQFSLLVFVESWVVELQLKELRVTEQKSLESRDLFFRFDWFASTMSAIPIGSMEPKANLAKQSRRTEKGSAFTELW